MNFTPQIHSIETAVGFKQLYENLHAFPGEVFLNLSTLDKDTNIRYAKQINSYKNACGCNIGSIFMLAALAIGAIWYVADITGMCSHYRFNIAYLLLLVLFFAVSGKLLGLLLAKIKLKRLLHQIKTEISSFSGDRLLSVND
jgi:Ca2+/Na+ antiporter